MSPFQRLVKLRSRRERAYLRWRMLRAHPTLAPVAFAFLMGWDATYNEAVINAAASVS